MARRVRQGDRAWVLALALSFAFGLAVSWQRWGNPLIDTGREMNQPLRLASGEMLYSDVRHIYGPLSPWLHAVLYETFGPSLNILYIDGILTALAVVALLYWLGRQIMRPAAAGAATLSVMWICVFKPAGNYMLPYSFNALHGAFLGLLALAALTAALKRPERATPAWFLAAGAAAAAATLAKTELGLAAAAAGVVASWLARPLNRGRGVLLVAFLAPVVVLTAAVYSAIAMRVGWSTLLVDSWLLFYNAPPELAHFNRWISGFDDPVKSIRRMIIAALKLGMLAALVAAFALWRGTPAEQGRARSRLRPWHLIAAVAVTAAIMALTIGFDSDKGPYLAMPILLAGLLVSEVRRVRLVSPHGTHVRTALLITFGVYALVSLARILLHVRSGGAYGSVLLPVSVLLFMYLWVGPFARRFGQRRSRRAARQAAVALVVINAVATAGILAYRYQTRQTVAVETARGTMIVEPDVGEAWNEALSYIDRHTDAGDPMAVLPEGTSLNFLSGRRNPLRDEISIPGVLDERAERQAIARLEETRTPLVLITNRPTTEFGRAALGRDYGQRLMRWVEANYGVCATFGPDESPALDIGDEPFFIRAYCRGAVRASRNGN